MNGITVSTNKGETAIARPTTGDDVGLVEHGAFWWDTLDGCQNEYPIFYGQKLKGARVVYPDDFFDKEARGKEASHVAPKPLLLGVVYEVSMTSSGSGYGGSTYFRISKDGLLETWPNDPTPPVLDKDGYDVSGPYKSPPAAPTNVRLSSAELARLTN